MLILIGILYVICGILAYGLTFYYFQNKYSISAKECYKDDMYFSLAIGVGGPLGLIIAVIAIKTFGSNAKFKLKFK